MRELLDVSRDMHEDESRAPASNDLSEPGVMEKSCDVVHDIGTGVQGRLGDRGLPGVDREKTLRPGPQSADDRNNARNLLFVTNGDCASAIGLAARTRRLTPDVQNVRTLRRESQAMLDRPRRARRTSLRR